MNSVSFCAVKANPRITKEIAECYKAGAETAPHQTVAEASKEVCSTTNKAMREAAKAKYFSPFSNYAKEAENSEVVKDSFFF